MTAGPLLAVLFPEAADTGRALRDAGMVVGVAESCTGGLLGAVLTAVPGSSAYVAGGVIAYSNAVKETLLGVSGEVLARHGAVSEPVAVLMAEGVRRVLGCDLGLSITGVAGPGHEGSDKPAGLIYVACAAPNLATTVARLAGDHGREANRATAVRAAMRLAREAAAAGRP